MAENKVKKYIVTRSLRMPNVWLKGIFFGGLAMAAAAVILALSCLIRGTTAGLGVAVILALFSAIWLFVVFFNSSSNYGVSMISFSEACIKFYYYKEEYKLDWDKVVSAGIEKTRRAYWVYLADHELSAEEKKEFPEHAGEGVMYYGYEKNAWDEMMLFAPESVKAQLEAAIVKTKIK